MNATDVVAYTYQAELLHPSCTVLALEGDRDPYVSVETILDHAAARRGVDRYDEHSYDSDDFPKVVFGDQINGERCDSCGEEL